MDWESIGKAAIALSVLLCAYTYNSDKSNIKEDVSSKADKSYVEFRLNEISSKLDKLEVRSHEK